MPPYGRYQLLGRLAVGGMAEVFIARRLVRDGEDQRVVVKRLLPHLGDRPQFVRMFLDEARLTAQLCHPNVVRIEGLGEVEGVHYIAMEYVDGLSLASLVSSRLERRLEVKLACYVVAEACAALAYAHDKCDERGAPMGIVHRDVSPENILLSRAGQVKLADFGIAKAKTQINRTLPGQFKGKPCYMSPEQAMREQGIDHRSDIFSAGVVLYELTVGQRLFRGANDAELLSAVVHGVYPPPLPAGYPASLEGVVRRALSKEPAQRYQHAAQMREALIAELDASTASYAVKLGELVCLASPPGDGQPSARDRQSTEVGTSTVGFDGLVSDEGRNTVPGVGPQLLDTTGGAAQPPQGPMIELDTITDVPLVDDEDELESADTIKEMPAVRPGASLYAALFGEDAVDEQQRPRSPAARAGQSIVLAEPVALQQDPAAVHLDSAGHPGDDEGPLPIRWAPDTDRHPTLWRWVAVGLFGVALLVLVVALVL